MENVKLVVEVTKNNISELKEMSYNEFQEITKDSMSISNGWYENDDVSYIAIMTDGKVNEELIGFVTKDTIDALIKDYGVSKEAIDEMIKWYC